MRVLQMLFVMALLILPAASLWAETAGNTPHTVEITTGSTTITLTPESLAVLPQVERDVSFQTSKGPSSGHYKGVLFWDVLTASKVLEGLEHNAELKKTFLVTARDGYQIAFSIGEIHPDFGKSPMMIATEVDGKPFRGGLRIIVPGDTRGAHNVREVMKIELW